MSEMEKRLDEIGRLPYDWNGNSADRFNKSLIDKCKKIVSILPVESEIYPTANGSVQMEYEEADGSYLEFEISENETVMLKISETGKESSQSIYGIGQIAKEVEKFHEFTT